MLRILIILSTLVAGVTSAKRPNILFIGVDDLRPELGCYGSPIAITPNIDRLAADGLQFNRAYCQQAICGPSRASLMSGARPDSIGITHNYVKLRALNPNIVTLSQQFHQNGYTSVGVGKIFHHGDKDPASWNRPPTALQGVPQPKGFALEKNNRIQFETRKEMFAKYGDVAKFGLAMGPAYEKADVPDNTYVDGYNTEVAIATLKELVMEDKPFFLALGFHKPHLNWIAPQKYWDLYDRQQIPMTHQTKGPTHGAAVGLHPSFELRVRAGIPKQGELDPELQRTLKHAYLACVSYVDAQVGRMMSALRESSAMENTIVIFWSDHGFHLGEMGVWCKATNYEIATRVPLLIWTPDMPDQVRGTTTDALVELVDMYPTLCELAGLDLPDYLDGRSFVPLLSNPTLPWKRAAYSQFPSPALREWGAYPIRPAMRETYFGPLIMEVEDRIQVQVGEKWDRDLFENNLMGYAVRTDKYRLILWKDMQDTETAPLYIELYNHLIDPEETVNIAADHPQLVSDLIAFLQ